MSNINLEKLVCCIVVVVGSTEEDDQNTILQKLESCLEKQSVDFAKQLVEILHQNDLLKK